jgi:hypothetical protein
VTVLVSIATVAASVENRGCCMGEQVKLYVNLVLRMGSNEMRCNGGLLDFSGPWVIQGAPGREAERSPCPTVASPALVTAHGM